jgi:TPR repeat protein
MAMRHFSRAILRFVALAAAACGALRAEEVDFNNLRAQAEIGDVSAETRLGLAYCFGLGVPLDYQQGRTWLQKAADAKSPAAESALGLLYDKGLGVPQDDQQAWHWYQTGANAGDANGQESVGEFYAAGRVVAKDEAQAATWFAKAASQGNVVSENRLGLAYQKGKGVPADSQKAFTYFLQAASHNFGPAQFNVALCYWNGFFVPRDPVKAYLWCTLAVRSYPGKEQEDLLHQLTTTLTGAQLEAGDALVDTWMQDRLGHSAAKDPGAIFTSGTSARMPFRSVVGHIVITATLAGHAGLKLLVDTGASASFLDQKTADALAIKPSDTYSTGSGIGKDLLLSAVTNPVHLTLPGLDLANVSFRLFSTSPWDRPIGMHLDGIIGTDILQHYAIRLDYRRRTIEFMDPTDPDASRGGDAIPLQAQHSLILLQGTIRKFDVSSNPTSLILDTGSNESVTLSRNFLTANPGLHFARGTYSYSLGGGGQSNEILTRCAAVQLGDMVIKNPLVHLVTQNQGLWASGWAGSIGNDILQHFDVTINFPASMLYLRPNSAFRDIDEYDAGVLLKAKGWIRKNYVATTIIPGSPAAQAGLAPGDAVVQVDGIALNGLTLEDARALLRPRGVHNLLVNRRGKIVSLGIFNG